MDSDTSIRELEAQIQKLERSVAEEAATEQRASRSMLQISAVLAFVVLTFVLINYSHFKSEWTAEKFSKSLQSELELLNPPASDQLQILGKNLLPVYAEESRKQFDRIGPELARSLGNELDQLGTHLQKDTQARLAETERKIGRETEHAIYECYPSLQDDATRAAISKSFEKITTETVSTAIRDFDRRFSKDVDQLGEALLTLDVADNDEPTINLQKRFLSLWLRQLDREIQKL